MLKKVCLIAAFLLSVLPMAADSSGTMTVQIQNNANGSVSVGDDVNTIRVEVVNQSPSDIFRASVTLKAPVGCIMKIWGLGGISEGTLSIRSQGAELWTYTNTNNIENIWSPQNVLTFSISGKSVVLDATVEVYNPKRITTESVLQAFLEHGRGLKTLTLASDIQLTRRAEIRNIFTDEANNVTIDLNGHTISRNFSAAYDDGNVFYVESGNLTINDNSGNGSGKITGGWANRGGGINVARLALR